MGFRLFSRPFLSTFLLLFASFSLSLCLLFSISLSPFLFVSLSLSLCLLLSFFLSPFLYHLFVSFFLSLCLLFSNSLSPFLFVSLPPLLFLFVSFSLRPISQSCAPCVFNPFYCNNFNIIIRLLYFT